MNQKITIGMEAAYNAAVSLPLLFIWEIVWVCIFLIATILKPIGYGVWLPMLAVRSVGRMRYGIPFRKTWEEGYCFGEPYDPQKTLWAGAQKLLLEPIYNVFWGIRREFCTQT